MWLTPRVASPFIVPYSLFILTRTRSLFCSHGTPIVMFQRTNPSKREFAKCDIRAQLQPRSRTKQAYPGVGVFLLATGGKVQAVIAIKRSDIMVGVGTVENGALAVRQ